MAGFSAHNARYGGFDGILVDCLISRTRQTLFIVKGEICLATNRRLLKQFDCTGVIPGSQPMIGASGGMASEPCSGPFTCPAPTQPVSGADLEEGGAFVEQISNQYMYFR